MSNKINRLFSNSYENIWIRNIVFSSLIYGAFYFPTQFDTPKPGSIEQSGMLLFIFLITKYLFILFHNHFLIRLLLFKKKYRLYFLAFLFYLTLFAALNYWTQKYSHYQTDFFSVYISALLITLLGFSFYLIHLWILNNIINIKKELLNKKNELDFLNKQVSPHFLLNAINNLYGVALTSPQLIADKLLELSDLLRYQIESVKKDSVNVEEEIIFIENYYNYTNSKINNLEISNNIEGKCNSVLVPPLLFLPLIENAIKYSIETDNAFIRSNWKFEKNSLTFTIENNYLKIGSVINGTKIGIENLKNRLQLLKIKYDLKVDTSIDNIYKTELKLWELSINA